MAEKKEYKIKVQGQLVSVNEEVYLTYYRMKRRETYLEERDTTNGVFYYSALDTEGTNGEDVIPDRSSSPVEDMVVDKLITEKLHRCLAQLAKEEQELISTLFFKNKSEHQLAAETGIPRMTLHDRKVKILRTLKKLMEK
jgi:RNA polymerase sigma factor (sigma-70 family)